LKGRNFFSKDFFSEKVFQALPTSFFKISEGVPKAADFSAIKIYQ